MLDGLLQDVRLALRSLRASPGFTVAAVLTLALSIGGTAAFFSLLNGVVLRRLPVPEPDRLVAISVVDDRGQAQPFLYTRMFETLRSRQRVFESMAMYSGGALLSVIARGPQLEGLVETATPEFYPMLGVRPLAGRLLSPADAPLDGEAAPVVVLGERFWRQQFGGDPHAIGQRLTVDGVPLTVIGVTPPGFHGLQVDAGADFLVPMSVLRRIAGDPRAPLRARNLIGRLRPGVTLEDARAEMSALWPAVQEAGMPPGLPAAAQQQIRAVRPKVEGIGTGFSMLRLRYADSLTVLVGLAAALLAIGCANLGGLLLSRAAARDRQLAICLALGATRGRLIQRVAVESLLLSTGGAVLALPLAWWASRALARTLRGNTTEPLAMSVTPDGVVLTAAAVVSISVALIVSLPSAWLTTRSRAGLHLRPARGVTASITRSGRLLLVGQIAVSMILLVGAGLFARSLTRLRDNGSVFPAGHLTWTRLWLKPAARTAVFDATYFLELERQLSARIAIESIGFSMVFPASFNFTARLDTVSPAGAADRSSGVSAIAETVSPRFFETIGVARLRGRDFTWHDGAQSAPVAIVNSSLAARLFPGGDAIGRAIRTAAGPGARPIEIVGVVSDAPIGNLRDPHAPAIFRPILQEPQRARVPILSVRSRTSPTTIAETITAVVDRAGPHYIRSVSSMDDHLRQSLVQERLLAWLAICFAAVAALLAAIGVYSLLAYAIARRTREIGVRMALGASRGSVWRMVAGEGLALAAVGVLLGIPSAIAVARLARSLVTGIDAGDPIAIGGAAAGFLIVAAMASAVPAYRAASVDPMRALRQE